MKYCTRCGNIIEDDATVCSRCGWQVRERRSTNNMTWVAPVGQLNTKRGLLKYILLSLVTFGIYSIVVMSGISNDINTIAGRYDGKKTMHYCLVFFVFSWLTFGIVPLVWCHRISNRIGGELRRRGIAYSFGAGAFWGWNVLGALIIVGPFIYLHKMFKAMNLLSENYNVYG